MGGLGLGQPGELPAGEPLWPVCEGQERARDRPDGARVFGGSTIFQPHLDRLVVLPRGVELLGQQGAIPSVLSKTVSQSQDMRGFLANIPKEDLDAESFRARLWHYGVVGKEKEIKRGDKKQSLWETAQSFRKQEDAGEIPPNAPVYMSELRWMKKVRHPVVPDEHVKTSTSWGLADST
ncbi:unnamed protein product [Prorocentrum cordatum]|uniref:Uncharacterized protein n=1 Tax=Prorocentrum cordatum TaxID=2364126 RepID=A0ABN9YJH6_9DINO|nr:unnamed protein product [Polarella glacialis]